MRDWPNVVKPDYDRAIFIDRDGTIVVDTHFPHRVEELAFLPRSLDGLARLAALPVHIIVVSNQAGIALGLFRREDMSRYNSELRRRVQAAGARIDAFYYCPHKEPKHLAPGERACQCAKPAPGMLLEAAVDFGVKLKHSFMVGDKMSDIAAGQRAGCKTLLVKTGKAGQEQDECVNAVPDLVVADLFEAAEHLKRAVSQNPASGQ